MSCSLQCFWFFASLKHRDPQCTAEFQNVISELIKPPQIPLGIYCSRKYSLDFMLPSMRKIIMYLLLLQQTITYNFVLFYHRMKANPPKIYSYYRFLSSTKCWHAGLATWHAHWDHSNWKEMWEPPVEKKKRLNTVWLLCRPWLNSQWFCAEVGLEVLGASFQICAISQPHSGELTQVL